jgi:hypothetical protein
MIPKKTETEILKVKLISGGAKGLFLHYAYKFSYQGGTWCRNRKQESDISPHDDLIRLINSLKVIVAKVECFDYAREVIGLSGFEPTDTQIKLTEGVVQTKIESIEVTGISISEKKDGKHVVITYKKSDKMDCETGHATNPINYTAMEIKYGIEDDLKAIVDNIVDEAYMYEFEGKYADKEQLTFDYEEVEELED